MDEEKGKMKCKFRYRRLPDDDANALSGQEVESAVGRISAAPSGIFILIPELH